MKASELRIGNKVFRKMLSYIGDDPSEGFAVVTVDEETFNDMKRGAEYKPIPLTSEWLERFDFENNFHQDYRISICPFNNGKQTKFLTLSGDYLFIRENDGSGGLDTIVTIWNKDLKKEFYVHELQNTYFILSGGKELTIKPDTSNNETK